ncbi:cyclopropane-fatty-acyl-phospholipid synthase family protein [Sphingomonas sp.]|jgi:cyclopropane-fatty-acyl-phospholipid synthase|uniref:cyclopropane-fatty-acyl-phospholipid synthase family protein n=1 Tax=Sphingomonas sp. TaxID=28214 RepID=UPI002D80EA82|nr:cyclopropane-fatty-acyl-phospholipid synthase family protein [Sphingomonas sp.]HEU0044992.1 cyclopropane-fatty-acyl-phospholipid synthase family protein [Sphingomonas sp.]
MFRRHPGLEPGSRSFGDGQGSEAAGRALGDGTVVAHLLAPAFHRILDRIDSGLAEGGIEASLPDGTHRLLGGRRPGPTPIVAVHRWRALVRLVTGGSIGWYQAWADGDWSSPDPVPLFDLFMRNRVSLGRVARSGGPRRLAARVWHAFRRNTPTRARENIEAHYDLGNDFYREWLDDSLTYSAAMFEDAEPLEVAQKRKLHSILSRTGATPGNQVLEIGCGWGSFASVAANGGIRVHGITLSSEQKAVVDSLELPGVTVSLTDYREEQGQYDAVASIEMVEAVGQEYWPAYLDTIARVLRSGGRAALQYISIADDVFPRYAASVDFIQRYIFPGGMLLSTTRFQALAEERGLVWTDVHAFGIHYAETLHHWRERFDLAVAEGRLPKRLDARFVALWRYYLMYCEGGFRGGGIEVQQVTLVKR